MKYLTIILIIISNMAFASQGAELQGTYDCDKNQLSMNFCARDRFNHYDKILNEVYKTQMSYLSDGKYKKYLRESQRAWIEFRDKDCTYSAGKQEDSGSIWPLEYYSCLTNRTKTRIEELNAYVRCRQNGCPW